MAEATVAGYGGAVKVFPGVCPAWDNQARRPNSGFCFHGSTPAKYGRWLAAACRVAVQAEVPDERIVFVNAWNEWAEGAYLEPDRHYGYAYLAETARVVRAVRRLAAPMQVTAASAPTAGRVEAFSAESFWFRVRQKVRRTLRQGANAVSDVAEVFAQKLRGD